MFLHSPSSSIWLVTQTGIPAFRQKIELAPFPILVKLAILKLRLQGWQVCFVLFSLSVRPIAKRALSLSLPLQLTKMASPSCVEVFWGKRYVRFLCAFVCRVYQMCAWAVREHAVAELLSALFLAAFISPWKSCVPRDSWPNRAPFTWWVHCSLKKKRNLPRLLVGSVYLADLADCPI